MVRRLPVLQNNAPAAASGLGLAAGTAALVVVGGFCWAVLLWAFAGFGWATIAVTCFAACAISGAIVGSQISERSRKRGFAQSAAGFALTVQLVALLGGALPNAAIFGSSLLTLGALSATGFFVGGWFLTLRR